MTIFGQWIQNLSFVFLKLSLSQLSSYLTIVLYSLPLLNEFLCFLLCQGKCISQVPCRLLVSTLDQRKPLGKLSVVNQETRSLRPSSRHQLDKKLVTEGAEAFRLVFAVFDCTIMWGNYFKPLDQGNMGWVATSDAVAWLIHFKLRQRFVKRAEKPFAQTIEFSPL